MTVAIEFNSCFVSSDKISHFGPNPVSGGNPPKDKSTKGVSAVMVGDFDHDIARALIEVVLFSLNRLKIDIVIKI